MKAIRVRLYVSEERIRAYLAGMKVENDIATCEVRGLLGDARKVPMPKGWLEITPRANTRGVLEVKLDAMPELEEPEEPLGPPEV